MGMGMGHNNNTMCIVKIYCKGRQNGEISVRQTERRQRERERESERDVNTPHRPDDDSPYEPPRYTFTIVGEPIALVGQNVSL